MEASKRDEDTKKLLMRLLDQFDQLSIEEITKQLIELLVFIKTPIYPLYSNSSTHEEKLTLREALQKAIDDLDSPTVNTTRSVTKRHYKKHAKHLHL